MKLKSNILTALALGFVMAFTACSKDDGAIPDRVNIEDVPAITTNLTTGGGTAANITLSDPASFSAAITVKPYFENAVPPTKIDMVVRKNGLATNVRVFRADVATLPLEFTITATDITTLFGEPLALNDTYDFAPDIYVGAKKYEAYPVTGTGNAQGITGMSAIGFGVQVRFTVK